MTGGPVIFCAVCGRGLHPGDLMCSHTELEIKRAEREGCACGEEHVAEVVIHCDGAED